MMRTAYDEVVEGKPPQTPAASSAQHSTTPKRGAAEMMTATAVGPPAQKARADAGSSAAASDESTAMPQVRGAFQEWKYGSTSAPVQTIQPPGWNAPLQKPDWQQVNRSKFAAMAPPAIPTQHNRSALERSHVALPPNLDNTGLPLTAGLPRS